MSTSSGASTGRRVLWRRHHLRHRIVAYGIGVIICRSSTICFLFTSVHIIVSVNWNITVLSAILYESSRPVMAWITVLCLIYTSRQVVHFISINPTGQPRRRSGRLLQSQRGNH